MDIKTWKVGGPAGFGIMSAGLIFAKALKRMGYFVHGYPEYPSIIKGGYNCYSLSFSNSNVYSPYKRCDILVALDKVAFEREKITQDMIVIADFKNIKGYESINCKKVDIPFKDILKEKNLPDIVKNSIALGASAKILNIDSEIVFKLFEENFPKKVLQVNIEAAKMGMSYCNDINFDTPLPNRDFKDNLVMTGNDSIVAGAVAAGVGFYSTYPMTPASSILHSLAEIEEKYNIVVKHTEDEISGIIMAIGASFSGVRAMTGTSGGGLSLMTEGVGLSAMTEIPLVIVVSQRPGPATGMPTWNAQADLKFVMNISQDEFIRVVYTPGDLQELFDFTFQAFNIADKYHVPVFILSDKFLSESHFSTKPFDTKDLKVERGEFFKGDDKSQMEFFPRYKEYKNGVGLRVLPGTPGGLYKAVGNEHDDYGFVATESDIRKKNQIRRFKKENFIKDEMPKPKLYGKQGAEITFVCFGSTKLPLMEALKHTDKFNFIHFPATNPIDWEYTEKLLTGKHLVAIEANFTGQLASIIREQTGVAVEDKFLKYDGRPFFVEEILEYVNGRQ